MRKKLFIALPIVLIAAVVSVGLVALKVATANSPYFVTGQKVVTTKGNPEPLATSTVMTGGTVVVKAKTANTGAVYVGYSAATALNTNSDYFSLLPGASLELEVSNTNLIWLDAESGEGVEYVAEWNR